MIVTADMTNEATVQLLHNLQQSAQRAPGACAANTQREADYKAAWLTQLGLRDDPAQTASPAMRALSIALQGGALADCLSHVFIAGYQGAIRHVLPTTPAAQWFSLLVSEDQQDPSANPGTRLQHNAQGAKVTGTKSWVASSETLDGLVVSAKSESGQVQWFWCSAQDPAVTLSHRPAPSFLPDVSQGFARFDGLQVPWQQLLDAEAFAKFMHCESLYVGLALLGYLWRHWHQREDLPDAMMTKAEPARSFAIAAAAGLADAVVLTQQPNGELPLALLHGWQLRIANLLEQFEQRWLGTAEAPLAGELAGSAWAERWWRDHRLTAMYAPMIRSQFGKAMLTALFESPAKT